MSSALSQLRVGLGSQSVWHAMRNEGRGAKRDSTSADLGLPMAISNSSLYFGNKCLVIQFTNLLRRQRFGNTDMNHTGGG